MKNKTRLIIIGILIVVIIISTVITVIQDNRKTETISEDIVLSDNVVPVSEDTIPPECNVPVSETDVIPENDSSGQESSEPSDSVPGAPAAS